MTSCECNDHRGCINTRGNTTVWPDEATIDGLFLTQQNTKDHLGLMLCK